MGAVHVAALCPLIRFAQAVAAAQASGESEVAFLSFLKGKKERRKAKELLAEHLPELKLRKVEIDGSLCLKLSTTEPSDGKTTTQSGPNIPRSRETWKERQRASSFDEGEEVNGGAELKEEFAKEVARRVTVTRYDQPDQDTAVIDGIEENEHIKYVSALYKRFKKIEAIRKIQRAGKELNSGQKERLEKASQGQLDVELASAVRKAKENNFKVPDELRALFDLPDPAQPDFSKAADGMDEDVQPDLSQRTNYEVMCEIREEVAEEQDRINARAGGELDSEDEDWDQRKEVDDTSMWVGNHKTAAKAMEHLILHFDRNGEVYNKKTGINMKDSMTFARTQEEAQATIAARKESGTRPKSKRKKQPRDEGQLVEAVEDDGLSRGKKKRKVKADNV